MILLRRVLNQWVPIQFAAVAATPGERAYGRARATIRRFVLSGKGSGQRPAAGEDGRVGDCNERGVDFSRGYASSDITTARSAAGFAILLFHADKTCQA
jgi:hypothetical protein